MKIPKYKELAMKTLYEWAMQVTEVRAYLPEHDMIVGSKMPDREFFLGILCTLKEDEMHGLLDNAIKKRFEADNDPEQKSVILIN